MGWFPQVAEANARTESVKLENEKARMELEDRKAARNWDGAADILAPKTDEPRDAPPVQLSGEGMDQNAAARAAAAARPEKAEDRIGYAIYQNPELAQDPGVDQKMRAFFSKNKNEAGLKWWDTVRQAQGENFFSATQAAVNGDLDGAKKNFNASGKYQLADLQWADEGKTTLKGTMADGKEITINPRAEMKRLLSPHEFLNYEAARAEKAIQKVGDKAIVRVNADGTATPLYEADQYGNTPDGDIYSKRTGEKKTPAADGVNPPPAPKLGSHEAARIDARVKMSIDKVILPKYGGRFEGGMFFPDEANKDVALRATELAGQLVRQGVDPEAAGAQAVAQAEREKALKPKPGGKYEGPTPWKKPTSGGAAPAAAGGVSDYSPPRRGVPANMGVAGTR